MGPGLARMLDMIIKTPSDTMLVDRFLVLASDIPELERADATLKLARSLLPLQPRRSLEIAWMVYKSGLKDIDALHIICDALEKIERPNKAQLIRVEIRRIGNLQISAEARQRSRQTIEDHVSTTLSGGPDAFTAEAAEITRSELLPVARDADAVAKSDHEISPTDVVAEDQQLKAVSGESPVDMARIVRISRVARGDMSEGIPEAIPPKEPSRHLAGIDAEHAASVATRYSVRREGSTPNFTPETGHSAYRRGMTADERRQRLKDLVKAQEWESVLELLNHSFADASDRTLLHVFEQNNLSKIDIRFAGWWVDILTQSHQERRALRFILQKLAEEPHLAWARMFWPKVPLLIERLDLEPIDWRESDGVSELRAKISGLRPCGGVYVV